MPRKEDDTIILTQKDVKDFFAEKKVQVRSECPRCASKDWDISSNDNNAIFTKLIDHEIELYVNATYFNMCDNCGYKDTFILKPLIEWAVDNVSN